MKVKVIPYIPARDRRRFWSRVDKNGPVPAHRPELGPCWLWLLKNGTSCSGRGTFRSGGVQYQAARVALAISGRPIYVGQVPDHLCLNPPCVNPAHLEAVTNGENVRRGVLSMSKNLGTACGTEF